MRKAPDTRPDPAQARGVAFAVGLVLALVTGGLVWLGLALLEMKR